MAINEKLPASKGGRFERSSGYKKATGPDPIENPEYYDGITIKRILAYVIDFIIIGILGMIGWFVATFLGALTLGLLLGPLYAALVLIPLAYHTFMIASPGAATLGMRFLGIKVYRLNGQEPDIVQAFVMTAIFLLTVPVTSSLILIVALFNTQRRCLHDMLSVTIVLNKID